MFEQRPCRAGVCAVYNKCRELTWPHLKNSTRKQYEENFKTYLLPVFGEPSRSLAWLLTFTGLRVGELLALRWRDVDLEGGFIRVRQSVYEGVFDDPKTKRSRRTVPLGTQGTEILKGRKPTVCDPENLVFAARNGSPLCRRNLLNRQLKPTCEKLKLEGVTWHWLRHVNATLLDSVGASIGTMQALLGHSSSEITRDVYLHSVSADARQTVQRVEELIGPKWTQVPAWPDMLTNVTQ
jgi:integrase